MCGTRIISVEPLRRGGCQGVKFSGAILDEHLVYEVLIEEIRGASRGYVLRSGLMNTPPGTVENGGSTNPDLEGPAKFSKRKKIRCASLGGNAGTCES